MYNIQRLTSVSGSCPRRKWIGGICATLALSGCDRLRDLYTRASIPARGTIHALVWSNYFPQDLLNDFEAITGIRVSVHTFSTNDQLVDLLSTRSFPYDLVMPSSYMLDRLRELDLLRPLRQAKMPNLKFVDRLGFPVRSDPYNQWIVPYIWGAVGLGYQAKATSVLPKSWAAFFKPPASRGKNPFNLSILDDGRVALASALLYAGVPPQNASEKQIEEAGNLIIGIKDRITYFESDNVAELLAEDKVQLAMAWSGDVCKAMLGWPSPFSTKESASEQSTDKSEGKFKRNISVRLALPLEGTVLFQDSFAIPKLAAYQSEAEEFVNFLLSPETAAKVTNFSLYANTITASRPDIHRFILSGPSYFRNPTGKSGNFAIELPASIDTIYSRVWHRVKATISGPPPASPKLGTVIAPIKF